MVNIATITDETFGETPLFMRAPALRYATRGILRREDGCIAVFHKAEMRQYKLPGGGLEKCETPQDAFVRECLEETGCEAEIVAYLGHTEERKSKTNFRQVSYVFEGKVVRDTGAPKLTDKEKREGGEVLWLPPQEALRYMQESEGQLLSSPCDAAEDLYGTKFVVRRDICILQYYLRQTETA